MVERKLLYLDEEFANSDCYSTLNGRFGSVQGLFKGWCEPWGTEELWRLEHTEAERAMHREGILSGIARLFSGNSKELSEQERDLHRRMFEQEKRFLERVNAIDLEELKKIWGLRLKDTKHYASTVVDWSLNEVAEPPQRVCFAGGYVDVLELREKSRKVAHDSPEELKAEVWGRRKAHYFLKYPYHAPVEFCCSPISKPLSKDGLKFLALRYERDAKVLERVRGMSAAELEACRDYKIEEREGRYGQYRNFQDTDWARIKRDFFGEVPKDDFNLDSRLCHAYFMFSHPAFAEPKSLEEDKGKPCPWTHSF